MVLEVGSAYVTLLPSALNFGKRARVLVQKELANVGGSEGINAGDLFAEKFGESVETNLPGKVDAAVDKGTSGSEKAAGDKGKKAGKAFADGVGDESKNAGVYLSRALEGADSASTMAVKVGAATIALQGLTVAGSRAVASLAPLTGLLAAAPGALGGMAAWMAVSKTATAGFADAVSAAGEDAEKFAEATEGMAPSMVNAVKATHGLTVAFQGVARSVQGAAWSGVGAQLNALSKVAMPILRTEMTQVASSANKAGIELLKFGQSGAAMGTVTASMGLVDRVIKNITPAIAPFLAGLSALITASSDAMAGFTGAEAAANRFNTWAQGAAADGSMSRWLTGGVEAAGQLMSGLGSLVSIIVSVGSAALAAGGEGGGLGAFASNMARLAELVKSPEIQQQMQDAFARANAIMTTVVDVIIMLLPCLIQLAPVIVVMGAAWKVASAAMSTYRVISGMVTAVTTAMSAATALQTARTHALTAAQRVLNVAMRMNPFGIVLTVIMALVAGIALLWNKNEGFRTAVIGIWESIKGFFAGVWSTLTSGASAAWDGIVSAVSGVGDTISSVGSAIGSWVSGVVASVVSFGQSVASTVASVVRPALDGIGAVFTWLGGVISGIMAAVVSVITTAVRAWWAVFSWIGNLIYAVLAIAFFYLRDYVIRPVMAAVSGAVRVGVTAVVGAWNTAVAFIRGVLSAVWQWLLNSVIRPVMAAVTNAVRSGVNLVVGAWNTAVAFIRGALSATWQWLLNTIIRPVMNAVSSAVRTGVSIVTGIWNSLIAFIRGALTTAWNFLLSKVRSIWNAISSLLRAGYDKVIKPVFDQLKRAVEAVPGIFEAAKNGIKKAWDAIKRVALMPVEFVVQTVLNQGLVKGINSIGKPFGVSLSYIPWTAKLNAGGPVPGWSPNDRADNIPAMLTAKEYVTRRWAAERMRRKRPGVLEYINKHGDLPGYARGGRVFDSERPGPRMGGRTQPLRAGDRVSDSGVWRKLKAWVQSNLPGAQITSAYRATRTATGKISQHARGNAVDIAGPNMAGYFNAIAKAFPNSCELIYSPAGRRQIYRGRNHMYSGVTRANHWDHVHWSMGGFNGPSADGGLLDINPFDAIGNAATKLLDGVKSKFGDNFVTDLAVGIPKTLIGKASDWFLKKASEMFASDPASGSGGGNVQQWAGTVRQALKIVGQPESLVQTVLRRMNQESSGNARAINNWDINARRGIPSKGLMQVIDPTFRAYAMRGYNRDIYDPLSNILASMRYALARYGSLSSAYNRRGGYADGGWVRPVLYDQGGILPPGLSLVANQTGRPETIRTYEQERALQGRGDTFHITIQGVDANNAEAVAAKIGGAIRRERARVTR